MRAQCNICVWNQRYHRQAGVVVDTPIWCFVWNDDRQSLVMVRTERTLNAATKTTSKYAKTTTIYENVCRLLGTLFTHTHIQITLPRLLFLVQNSFRRYRLHNCALHALYVIRAIRHPPGFVGHYFAQWIWFRMWYAWNSSIVQRIYGSVRRCWSSCRVAIYSHKLPMLDYALGKFAFTLRLDQCELLKFNYKSTDEECI